MKRGEERKERLALTMLLSIFVFSVILLAVLVSAGLLYLLIRTGFLFDEEIKLWQGLLFLGAVSTILGFVLSALLSRISLGPVNHVINQLNRLAAGDFKARVKFGKALSSHSTFKEIEGSFNTMAEELDNTELLRSDFINSFSHEFKTPIVSIVGFAKLLKKGNLSEEEKANYIEVIEEESMRLSRMATNVLNLSKIEKQAILTDVTEFNLSEQIRGSVLLLENKWEPKNLEFDINFEEYQICANEEMLKQVWINLIHNAVKFSPEYGTVTINIKPEEDCLKISVSNHGPEIPEESIKHIWGKFYQADSSHSGEGNGIGLAIVKHVVELHKGTVEVESDPLRTTFTVTLPMNKNSLYLPKE